MLVLANPQYTGIVTSINATFATKARGRIEAKCEVATGKLLAEGVEQGDVALESVLRNEKGDVVCKVVCVWNIKRKKSKKI
jgi:hypothetical protein